MAYYAHSNFRTSEGEGPQAVAGSIKVGEEVTQEQIGASDEDWQEYIDRGVVSEDKPPDIPSDVAPAQFYAALARRVADGEATKEEIQMLRNQAIPQLVPGEPLASVLPPETEEATATPAKSAATPAKPATSAS